jgi:hypothetical protein
MKARPSDLRIRGAVRVGSVDGSIDGAVVHWHNLPMHTSERSACLHATLF